MTSLVLAVYPTIDSIEVWKPSEAVANINADADADANVDGIAIKV